MIRVCVWLSLLAALLFAQRPELQLIYLDAAGKQADCGINGSTLLLQVKRPEIWQDGTPSVQFGERNATLPCSGKICTALLPIDYYQKPGDYDAKATLFNASGDRYEIIFPVRIETGPYKKETITVSPGKVKPKAPEIRRRIEKEFNEAMRIYRTKTKTTYWEKPFIRPMDSVITSPFGTRREYNGQFKSYHSGTDFRAVIGTPVEAANDGVVVLSKERFYAGKSVVIDHGKGLYTCYYHLSKIDVAKGTLVKRGEQLGLSGRSGRVTGPHLHFAAMLHGVQVDPLQLIAVLNYSFK